MRHSHVTPGLSSLLGFTVTVLLRVGWAQQSRPSRLPSSLSPWKATSGGEGVWDWPPGGVEQVDVDRQDGWDCPPGGGRLAARSRMEDDTQKGWKGATYARALVGIEKNFKSWIFMTLEICFTLLIKDDAWREIVMMREKRETKHRGDEWRADKTALTRDASTKIWWVRSSVKNKLNDYVSCRRLYFFGFCLSVF